MKEVSTEIKTQFISDISDTLMLEVFLQSDLDGEMGQLRRRTEDLLWRASLEGVPTKPTALDDLFEAGYSYGLQIDRLNLDPELRERVLTEAFGVLPDSLQIESPEGKAYLPEFPVQLIRELTADSESYNWAKYACQLGLSAGILFSQGNSKSEVVSEESNIPARNELGLPQIREDLLQEAFAKPELLIDALLPGVQSLEDLERGIFTLKQLLPEYYASRIEKLIQAKKGNKVSYTIDGGYQRYSRWARFWEDPRADIVGMLFPDIDPKNKKEFFARASDLAGIELTAEVLVRDIEKGNIPDELVQIIDSYLFDFMTAGDQTPNIAGLIEFIQSQYSLSKQISQIEDYMQATPYWQDSGRRQTITPDRLRVTQEQLREIEEIGTKYADFMQKITRLYSDSLGSTDASRQKLVRKLEGGLPQESVEFLRKISKLSAGKPIGSLRFDLVPCEGKFYVCEAQLISGGTPPAVLYREAFEEVDPNGFVAEGVLPAFIDRLKAQSEDPVLAIVYSDRPYSSDISKTTSFAGNRAFKQVLQREGIRVRTVFSNELEKRSDGKWYFKDGKYSDMPITTAYNRTDVVSTNAARLLKDDSYKKIQTAMANGEIDAFPPPMPILFGKGIYALIWDEESRELLNEVGITDQEIEFLKGCTPETYWITQETIRDLNVMENPQLWIRKGSYQHATQDLVIGADYPDDLIRRVERDVESPYSATIQRLIESDQPAFRIPSKGNITVGKRFRLRIEPTYIDGRLVEIFLTGNPDRIVHGRETSIMSLAKIT